PRIWLGVAALPGVLDDVGKRSLPIVDVEEVRERARENALDARYLITGLTQIAQRADDRQPGAHVGLVQEMRAAGPSSFAQTAVEREIGAVGLLVGRDDVNARGQPLRVTLGDFRAGGTVDQHRMRK